MVKIHPQFASDHHTICHAISHDVWVPAFYMRMGENPDRAIQEWALVNGGRFLTLHITTFMDLLFFPPPNFKGIGESHRLRGSRENLRHPKLGRPEPVLYIART